MSLARIGLGSNLGDASANVRAGIAALARLGHVTAQSSLYRGPPWGASGQPDFVNAAALLETTLFPRALLAALKGLELELGRVSSYRWGPRHIDLDILAYDDAAVHEPGLIVPHERLFERAFALVPLAEIDPAFKGARDALPADELAALIRLP